jgi:hypothetical protein
MLKGPAVVPAESAIDVDDELASAALYPLDRLRPAPALNQTSSDGEIPTLALAPTPMRPLPSDAVSPVGSVTPTENPMDGDHVPGSACEIPKFSGKSVKPLTLRAGMTTVGLDWIATLCARA